MNPAGTSRGPVFTGVGLHEAIKKASKNVPRYLFRFWSAKSGGNADLNNIGHITPRAFHEQNGPKTLFEVQEVRLGKAIQAHLLNAHDPPSYFSSWSASLTFILKFAQTCSASHVAVIDTKRLHRDNLVYWCGSLDMFGERPGASEEYHIFGVVSRSAYQAIPYDHFKSLTLSAAPPLSGRTEEAIKIGKLFAGGFRLVVAAHILAMQATVGFNSEEVQRKLLANFDASEDVVDGSSFVQEREAMERLGYPVAGFVENENADKLLRAVVGRKLSEAGAAGKSGASHPKGPRSPRQ